MIFNVEPAATACELPRRRLAGAESVRSATATRRSALSACDGVHCETDPFSIFPVNRGEAVDFATGSQYFSTL